MNNTEIINLISGIASLILSVVAIWLSLYFYTQSKNTERNVTEALAGIKAQTDTLQKLTGKWIYKLISYTTEAPPAYSETLTTLMAVIQEMPYKLSGSLPASTEDNAIKKEMIAGYIGTYYYAAIANVAAQSFLPPTFDVLDEQHNALKSILDYSYADVITFKEMLKKDMEELTTNRAYNFFQKTENDWLPLVKNFEQAYQERQDSTLEV